MLKKSEPSPDSHTIPIFEHLIHTRRRIRLVCIGAGFAGLMLAHKIRFQLKFDLMIDLCIYEKNVDVGGTWLLNGYPGVRCDVPAHIYIFPFEPNPDWTSFYAKGPEIWEYIRRTTTKYGLDTKVQFNSKITDAIWDEYSGKWNLTIDQYGMVFNDKTDILVNGSGILNKLKWPETEGLSKYNGELIHTARWDQNFDWTYKSVAVIGNGSTAIQIVPQIQNGAMHVTNYIRSPTWVGAMFRVDDGKSFDCTEKERQIFRDDPDFLHINRKSLEHAFNEFYFVFLNDSKAQELAHEEYRRQMEERPNHNPYLIEKLVPDLKVGCRRVSPGDGYLEALQAENVTPEFRSIKDMTEHGIRTNDGQETEFDAIICATGFDVSLRPSWNLVGRDQRVVGKEAKDNLNPYLGVGMAGQPNYFMFPNCPVGHGSQLALVDWTAEYILRWCEKIASEDIKTVCVKDDAVREYNAYSQEFLKSTVWYKDGKFDEKVTAMYPGSNLHHKENLEHARGEDFNITYRSGNRFRYMGNGLTEREMQDGDLSYYVQK